MARKRKQVCPPEGDTTNGNEDDSDAERLSREDERGRTVLAAVGKAIQNGHKIPLEWEPITKMPCREHKLTFSTYIGVIVRERVCITYKTWKEVPDQLLNDLYDRIKKGFVVLEERKPYILQQADDRWRAFKTRLRRDWVYHKNSGRLRENPPNWKYPWITLDVWKKFVELSTTDTFKAVSEDSRDRSKLKTSSYCGGPLGYQYYRDEIAKECLEKGIHIEQVPRHEAWLRAHSHFKDEKYTFKNPTDLETTNAINALKGQVQRGEIVFQNQRDDILARALKKKEHGGRVRGVGSGITIKQYFGFAKPTPPSKLLRQLNYVTSEMAMLKNQNNAIMSFLLSGQNIEGVKQLVASGIGSQAGVSIGQGNGQCQPSSAFAQLSNAAQITNSSEFGLERDFLTKFLDRDVSQGGEGVISSHGIQHPPSQEYLETPDIQPHSKEQENEPEPYQVSWPEYANAESSQHVYTSVSWPETYDKLPISNLPEGMHDCCLAIEENKGIQIVATLVVENHFFDLTTGNHRVSILEDLVPTALLPCPTQDFMYVCQAKESFVPWTTRLIFPKKKYNITNEDCAMVTSGLSEVFKKEAMGMRHRNETIFLTIPFSVFHNEIVVRLDYKEMFDWCFQREVGASHMSIFMRYLSEGRKKESISGVYGFRDVNFISPLTPTEEGARSEYLSPISSVTEKKSSEDISEEEASAKRYVPLDVFKAKFEALKDNEDEFKRDFVVYALTNFLAPYMVTSLLTLAVLNL
uniref:Transposase n=1 Tax=Chenopodium quinoa TaxID=63459 RepID=A0A803MY04_CHEQI